MAVTTTSFFVALGFAVSLVGPTYKCTPEIVNVSASSDIRLYDVQRTNICTTRGD